LAGLFINGAPASRDDHQSLWETMAVVDLTARPLDRVGEAAACLPVGPDTGPDEAVEIARLIKGAVGVKDEAAACAVFVEVMERLPNPEFTFPDGRTPAAVYDAVSGEDRPWPELWKAVIPYGFDASEEVRIAEQWVKDGGYDLPYDEYRRRLAIAYDKEVPFTSFTDPRLLRAELTLDEAVGIASEKLATIRDPLKRDATRVVEVTRVANRLHVLYREVDRLVAARMAPHGQVPPQVLAGGIALRDRLTAPTPDWLVSGYLLANGQHILYGAPEALKSFTALDWCLHIATGRAWLGRPVERRGVVLYAGEAAVRLERRKAAWFAARGISVEDSAGVPFAIVDTVPTLGNGDNGLEAAVQQVRAASAGWDVPVGLIVLDTMTRVAAAAGLSTTDTGEYGRLLAAIDGLGRLTGAATLTIYHVPKSNPSGPTGTYQTMGNADVVIRADRDTTAPPHEPRTQLRVRPPHGKMRDGEPPADLVLQFREESFAEWLAASYARTGAPMPPLLTLALMPDFSAVGTEAPSVDGCEDARKRYRSLVVVGEAGTQPTKDGAQADLERRVLRVLKHHPGVPQDNVRKALRGFGKDAVAKVLEALVQSDPAHVKDERRGNAHQYSLTAAGVARLEELEWSPASMSVRDENDSSRVARESSRAEGPAR